MNFITGKAAFCLPEGVAMAHISYTMSTRGLPDMYTLSPRACSPQALGVYSYQANHSCPWYNYNIYAVYWEIFEVK